MKIGYNVLCIQSFMVREAYKIHDELLEMNRAPSFTEEESKRVFHLMGMLEAYDRINKLIAEDEET